MGRQPSWAKEHTTMLNTLEKKRVDAGKYLPHNKEWPSLSSTQQTYLVHYAVSGDAKRAAEEAEVDLKWVAEQEEDENFAFVMRNIMERPKKMAEKLALNALPLSVYLLVQQIKEEPTGLPEKKFRLEAIKHLHKLTGMQKVSDIGTTQMMQVNFDLQGLEWGHAPRQQQEMPSHYIHDNPEDIVDGEYENMNGS
jgi:hypothetical protein